jgi:ribonuclease HII
MKTHKNQPQTPNLEPPPSSLVPLLAAAQAQSAMWHLEQQHHKSGYTLIAGVDEAGRGALAGPVVVGAVILPLDFLPRHYRDSKTLSPQQRTKLALEIQAEAIAWAVEFASAAEVDEYNVLRATHRAAARALNKLEPTPTALITDYLKLKTTLPILHPPKADASSYNVAAASILAKTARDAYMVALGEQHPQYGFEAHKGYGASQHLSALEQFGVLLEHRRSFAPVALLVDGSFGSAIPKEMAIKNAPFSGADS